MIKRTLYFGNPAYLSMRNGQLLLRLPEVETSDSFTEKFKKEAVRTFPIEDLGVVVLDDKRITITHGALERLMENNVAVITCDSTHMPTGLLMPLNGHSLQSERFRDQIDCSRPLQKQLWQQTVQAKIANQAAALKQCEPQCEIGNMLAWASQVRSDDAENLEGRAAAYYWRNFFPECPGFVRHRELDGPNELLNYGYALVRAVVARSLVGAGLLPTLGIHHHNRYNAYCLADDIMEPYRPVVDIAVKRLVRQHGADCGITIETKQALLSLPTTEVTIAGHRSPLMVAVETTTASLRKCYAGEARKIIYPEM
ncbi:type II CRISPR-associated endonuclease Cas1 [Sodaliphilus sp.]|uniref:type II CRISPR-associated endonuclease Cas1 n=1 Tax=Sodaliphilus sp. TaxID=2815818 RepID=UPI00388D6B3D